MVKCGSATKRCASSSFTYDVHCSTRSCVFKVWPTEQDRVAVTHVMGMEGLEWEKVKEDLHYMSRAQYDACNEQL